MLPITNDPAPSRVSSFSALPGSFSGIVHDAVDEPLDVLAYLNSAWVEEVVLLSKSKKVILDLDSLESPVHGTQESLH